MTQEISQTTESAVEQAPEFMSQSIVASVIQENCRKQGEAIQAIEDSAYIVRRGQRELRDPKRLALSINLRSKYMADLAAYAEIISHWGLMKTFSEELYAELLNLVEPESRELKIRLARLLQKLGNKYFSPAVKHSE